MARLIDADALLKSEIRRCGRVPTIGTGYINEKNFEDILAETTTVDAVEVVHGYWVSDKADILFHCSVCETQISTDWDYDDLSWNYCPNCGAKMDGDADA